MIRFDSENNIFYLHSNNTSYIFGVRASDKMLIHLYWGKRLNNDVNLEVLNQNNSVPYYTEPPFE